VGKSVGSNPPRFIKFHTFKVEPKNFCPHGSEERNELQRRAKEVF